MKLLLISLFFFSIVKQLAGQDSRVDQIETQITNGNSKQWTLDSTKIFLGDTCSNGIKLSFFLNPHVVHEKICKIGNWVDAIYAWEIVKKEDHVVPTLLFYDKNRKVVEIYSIQFVEKSNSIYLRLRKVGSVAEETIDLYFK